MTEITGWEFFEMTGLLHSNLILYGALFELFVIIVLVLIRDYVILK